MTRTDVTKSLRYIPIVGPGVDALEDRKEAGSDKEFTIADERAALARHSATSIRALANMTDTVDFREWNEMPGA